MTKMEFAKTFAVLAEVYNREVTELLVEAYYIVLNDFTKEQFDYAVKQVLTSRKYSSIPLPADLLEAVYGNPDDKALLALKELEDAMAEHGAYKSVCFEDSIISTCVENLGGWATVCQMELKDWDWKKKEFLSLYKALIRNPSSIKKTPYLVGLMEHQNRNNGFDDIANETKVIMIGTKSTVPALQLMSDKKNDVLALASGIAKQM